MVERAAVRTVMVAGSRVWTQLHAATKAVRARLFRAIGYTLDRCEERRAQLRVIA